MKLAPHWQILISLALAVLLGLFIKTMGLQDTTFFSWVIEISGLVGKLFMNLLKMIIVPLVVSSVIAGIASLHGVKGFGRLLGKTSGFYAMSSFLAIILGLSLVNLIQPGLADGQPNAVVKEAFDSYEPDSSELAKIDQAKVNSEEQSGSYAQLSGFFLRMVPPNIFEAATQNGQMLGLIFFSLCFALAMTRLEKEKMTNLRDVFISFNDVMIVMTNYIMKLAPIGVFGLLVPVMVQTGGDLFAALAKYFVTVLLALGLHMFVVMPILIRVLGGINPLAHFRAMRTALMTAFSTASSSATLPVTMRCIQEKAGVSKGTASFTLPLGATVNMDGTALYECVAVIFVAQVMGIEMTFAAQFMVVAAALLTSVGVAGIPSASLVAIFVILKNSGIPGAETAVVALLSVDRLLDMSRTAVNVWGDSCAAVVVAKSEGEPVIVSK
ncbi:dicarboxylate/amino acid:cation symporter [Akkermansiaceae bacterium]|nr:dicarboxylate/amino acid:cation symporter [Akkermansiaceae bacterium]MDA8967263.1 dicarboxylate/amino acid:cation symporter [Akkermansiaceae bacterium]MDB4462633.1 dicarboxylate/amino acid:cation symporter [Akkermansiaceae bacterium]MDB4545572.1 dicarboxylate/amino acid:cation symporter [Akkermansiaceae bacterium]MDB4577987.1 dicarboxylate/amino acid:cation symporter [Akkermansiaceae bacterium]